MELSYRTQPLHLHIWYMQLVFVAAWHALRLIAARNLGLRGTSSDVFEEGPLKVIFR